MGHLCYYFTTYDIFEEHCFEHCHEKRTSILPAESLLMWHIQTIEIIPLTWALHSSNDPALLSHSLQLQTTSNIEYVQIFRGWDANGQFSHSGHIENKSQHGPELCSSSVMPLQNSVERKYLSFNYCCRWSIGFTIGFHNHRESPKTQQQSKT